MDTKEIMTEQVFEKIDDIYSEHDGGVIHLSEERMNHIKEIIQQVINFIPCCTKLKSKEDVIKAYDDGFNDGNQRDLNPTR
tara:strand:- start:7 stop:249 length:243 start_codon:yes stop_codon:yes gene_type:complete